MHRQPLLLRTLRLLRSRFNSHVNLLISNTKQLDNKTIHENECEQNHHLKHLPRAPPKKALSISFNGEKKTYDWILSGEQDMRRKESPIFFLYWYVKSGKALAEARHIKADYL